MLTPSWPSHLQLFQHQTVSRLLSPPGSCCHLCGGIWQKEKWLYQLSDVTILNTLLIGYLKPEFAHVVHYFCHDWSAVFQGPLRCSEGCVPICLAPMGLWVQVDALGVAMAGAGVCPGRTQHPPLG